MEINRIIEDLKIFYKFPAVYVIDEYGFVDVLSKAGQKWYKYGEPIGNPVLALMYDGMKKISDGLIELHLVEVSVKHVESREIVFTFLGDAELRHVYEVKPIGPVVKIYAKEEGNGIVFTDVTQLKQFIEARLRRAEA